MTVEMEAAVGSTLPLIDWIVKHHDALINTADAARADHITHAFEKFVETLLITWIMITAHKMQMSTRDAIPQRRDTLALGAVPVARACEIAQMNENVVRADNCVYVRDHRLIHCINAAKRPLELRDCFSVAKVRVGSHEDASS